MDLTILFSPLDESVYCDIRDQGSIYKNIRVFGDKMPDYKEAHIALFGIREERGGAHNEGCKEAPDEIRKKLYSLKRINRVCNIVDLGNLNTGVDLDETYTRVSEVCRVLLEHNVLPILLGGGHDLDYGQYRGYEDMGKLINMLNVDAFLDMNEADDSSFSSKHIHKILLHEPNYLMGYTHLAHQLYLIDPSNIAFLEQLYFEAYRVGHLRSNMKEIEPAIRNADMISFDITALKAADAPGNARAQPFGLTGEEACQICWYAGLNEKLSSIGFYEYNPSKDNEQKHTASIVATMIWYFIEGYYHRKGKPNFRGNDFIKHIVPISVAPEMLIFYKSKSTEKWWMEVTQAASDSHHPKISIVPCSYSDYRMATQGDLPDRYIFTLSKLS